MSDAGKGALWMSGAAAALTAMAACIRFLPAYSILLLIFLRNIINLGLMAPSVLKQGRSIYKTERWGLHAVRNAFLYAGNVAWFYGVTLITLADVAALQFTSPLFTALIAGVILREHIGGHRMIAIIFGFVGALIIIRPGMVPIETGTLLILLAALLYSGAHVVTKQLSETESGNTVVFYMSVSILIYSAIPAIFVWETPAYADIPAIIGLGITGYATHYCITRSLAAGDASFVIAFDFMRLPLSAILGWFLFSEAIDIWTCLGALTIFIAGYYSTIREAKKDLKE